MRRKTITVLVIVLTAMMIMTSCGQNSGDTVKENSAGTNTGDSSVCTEDFGTYTIPEGWVKNDEHSTSDKTFYVMDGDGDKEQPDNISVEVGNNRYSKDEHEQFRAAIMRQLSMQNSNGPVSGEGKNTDNGDVLYIFTIKGEDCVTVQYYIVGEKRYCFIDLTIFSGSEEPKKAAESMADSFKWNED